LWHGAKRGETLLLLLVGWNACSMTGSAQETNTRTVPPPGIAVPREERAELQRRVEELGGQIDQLRVAAAGKPGLMELLADVKIFHKAADWALTYDEFYRTNEFDLARRLLEQGLDRAKALRGGKAPWMNATGLVVRGFVSRIDGSIQPYGLVVPPSWASQPERSRRLDVWLHGRDDRLTELKFLAERQRSLGEFAPPDTFVLHPYGRYCNAFKFAGEVDVLEALEPYADLSHRGTAHRLARIFHGWGRVLASRRALSQPVDRGRAWSGVCGDG
jgi:hypothetical protein